jgi:hypothetical protein
MFGKDFLLSTKSIKRTLFSFENILNKEDLYNCRQLLPSIQKFRKPSLNKQAQSEFVFKLV